MRCRSKGGGMSAAEDLYRASPIRRRHRSTKAEVEARREKLLEIVEAMKPMTVRQVFYQATVRGIIEKSERGYALDVPAHIYHLGDHDPSGVNAGEKIGLAP